MKKLFTIFAVLAIASISMVQAYQTDSHKATYSVATVDPITTPTDTIEFVITDCEFYRYENSFDFTGMSADSGYIVSVGFLTSFAPGTYIGNMISYDDTHIFNTTTYEEAYVNNQLAGAVVTTDATTCNVKFNFIGSDSVLYKLDMTFTYPTEKEYYEITTTSATIDSVEMIGDNQFLVTFDEAAEKPQYKFELYIPDTYQEGTTISLDDSTAIYVTYTLNEYCADSYCGEITLTRNDSAWDIVGWMLCRDGVAFYFNCKHPVAVENVAMTSYDVYSEMQSIVICGAEEQMAAIYDINGRMVYNSLLTSDNARVNVAPGIYFVRINGTTAKVLVK